MMSPQQISEVWGPSALVHANASDVEGIGMPDDAKRLLVDVGLPKKAELCVSFSLDEGCKTLQAFAENIGVKPPADAREFIRIGTDAGTQLCLAIGNGAVFAIDPSGKLPRRFVSSSLLSFLELLRLYRGYAERVQLLAEEEIDTLVNEVAHEMRTVDSTAFDDSENWWSVIVEQMRDGLL